MARASERISPDHDDLDGQIANNGDENGQVDSTENGAGNGDGNIRSIDPGAISGAGDFARTDDGAIALKRDGTPARKRGRKPGSGAGSQSRKAGNNQDLKVAVDSLAAMLGFIHIGIASISKCPEMALDDSEAQNLANATTNVLKEFDYIPDPKIVAISGLVSTAAIIYGPRYYLIKTRVSGEKKEKKAGFVEPSNIGQFNPTDPSNFNLGG